MRRASALLLSAALHGGVLAALIVLRPIGLGVGAATPDDSSLGVEYVDPSVVAMPDQVLPAAPDEASDRLFEASQLHVDEFAFDVEKIRRRANALFPFLTLDLMFLDRVPADVKQARERLSNPHAAMGQNAAMPPLELSDDTLQQLVDEAWSRRRRWTTFGPVAALLSSHHPSNGRAPELVRAYLDQNILQPYCDGDRRDPRFWAMVENAADHVDFIDFIRSYARRFPSSRTTTELLFLLDELAQGSLDVIMMLMETRPDEHLAFTRTIAPDAYTLAVAIKDRYAQWLFERQIDKHALRRRYDELRLRLLQTIVETTPDGYRAADAKFLAGQVLFEMRRFAEAERNWRSMTPEPSDAYYRAATEMLDELAAGPLNPRAAQRILNGEYGRWRVFSIDRLRQFGHRCDTF